MAAVTSGQGILLPEKKHRKERKITVAVNSRDRNLGANYNTNEFRWSFRRPLKDITSVELVNGSVPADLYNVTAALGSFTFGENNGAQKWIVTLTPGQYNPTELCAELQIQLNAMAGKTNTYAVAYSGITKKMIVTATGGTSFSFYFQTGRYVDEIDVNTGAIQSVNCPAQLLGFEYQDTLSVGSIVSPNRMDPYGLIGRLYIHLNADNSIEMNRIECGGGRKDCFHILYLDQTRDGYYAMNWDTQSALYISSPAPIARMATMNISIRDEFYRLVDLSKHDFTLVFDITYLD
jgi:hypothetical protein